MERHRKCFECAACFALALTRAGLRFLGMMLESQPRREQVLYSFWLVLALAATDYTSPIIFKENKRMRPKLNLLDDATVAQVIDEGYALLIDPGVRVHNDEALKLLAQAGVKVDLEQRIARIPRRDCRAGHQDGPPRVFPVQPRRQAGRPLWRR